MAASDDLDLTECKNYLQIKGEHLEWTSRCSWALKIFPCDVFKGL